MHVIPFPTPAERGAAQVPPETMGRADLDRLRAAMTRCPDVLPPALADLVRRDLDSLMVMRYMPGTGSLMRQVIDELLAMPLPDLAA